MKKILLGLGLLIGSNVFAQSGKIVLINKNTFCAIEATLYATNAANPAGCSINSNMIIVPPGMAAGAWDPVTFSVGAGGPGYATPAGYGGCLSCSFRWTDISFTYRCPAPCTTPSATVSDPFVAIKCTATPPTWFYSGPPGCITTGSLPNAEWKNFLGAAPMANVQVTFR